MSPKVIHEYETNWTHCGSQKKLRVKSIQINKSKNIEDKKIIQVTLAKPFIKT